MMTNIPAGTEHMDWALPKNNDEMIAAYILAGKTPPSQRIQVPRQEGESDEEDWPSEDKHGNNPFISPENRFVREAGFDMLKPGRKSRINSTNETIRNNAGFKRNIVQGYPAINGQWIAAEGSSTGAPSLYATGDVEHGFGITSPVIRGDPPLPPTLNNVNPFDPISSTSSSRKRPRQNQKVSTNAPITPLERLTHNASTSRIDKIPRHNSFGGYGTRKNRRTRTHGRKSRRQRKTRRKKSRRQRRRTTHTHKKRMSSNKKTRHRKGGTGENGTTINNKPLSLHTRYDGLYVPIHRSTGEYKVEDENAYPGTMGNVAQVRGTGPTPVYNKNTGRFE